MRHSQYCCPLFILSSTIFVLVTATSTHCLVFLSSKASSSIARSALDGDSDSDEYEYSFRDSWRLIILGDLHMEDDMSYHIQARRDCLHALNDFPLLGALATSYIESPSSSPSSMELNNRVVESIRERPGGELTEEELKILLALKTDRYLGSHLVSLGDLGRKDIRHEQGDAGTTKSFEDAKSYFDGFGIDYDLVTVSVKIE